MQLLRLFSFRRRPYRDANLIEERIEAFFQLAVGGHDEFFVEVVAVDVDRCAWVDLSAHQNDAVL